MIQETYEKLRKEHPLLPEFDKLDHEFEISTIEYEQFLLREIKKKMAEKLEQILDVLERSINPDPNSFTDLYECRCFTNGEKKQIVDIFRHLMQHYRSILETDLIAEDKTDVETIKKIYDAWRNERKQIVPFIKKISGCWEKHVEPKEILEYLG